MANLLSFVWSFYWRLLLFINPDNSSKLAFLNFVKRFFMHFLLLSIHAKRRWSKGKNQPKKKTLKLQITIFLFSFNFQIFSPDTLALHCVFSFRLFRLFFFVDVSIVHRKSDFWDFFSLFAINFKTEHPKTFLSCF